MYLHKSHSGMSRYQQDLPHRTVSGTVRWSLCCLLVVLLCYCFMQPGLLFADSPLVTQEIRYHMPEAGEVFLIWGVNGWVVVPEENRPAGTVVKDGVMHTPMVREGDTFVAQVQVPANTTMDYGFLITKIRSGAAVYIWEANGEQDYHTIATQDGVIEVQTTLTLAQDQAPAIITDVPLVTQGIRYHMPEAGEVFLIWGVSGWGVVPEENRPVGTVVKDAVMHTPMVREGDIFVSQVQVPSGAAVDYGFLITKKRNGAAIEAVWEGDQAYRIIATQDDVTEVKATLTLAQARELLSVLDLALRLLIETCIIFGIGAILIRVSREHNRRNVMLLLFGLTLLGLVLRLYAAWDWNNCHPNNPERLIGDEPGYDNLARGMLQGLGFNWPGRGPLYPLWLAGVYLFTNGSYNAVPYVQALLGAAVIPLTYALGRRVFGHTVGLMAAFISAISYVLIHQSLHLLSEVLYTPVILLVAITLWDALREPTPRRFCWAGFWVGISNLVRPTLLFFPLAILALLVIVLDKWRAMRYWMIYVLTAMLVITPWILHNYVRYQAVFPLQTGNAILWQGSPEYYHLIHDQGYTYRRIWAEVLYGPGWEAHDPTGVEGDRWWTKRALRSIAAEPLVYLRYAAEKLGTYWIGDPNADWGDTHVFNYQALRRIGFSQWDAILFMIARALPILALLASFVVRRRWRTLLPIYALLIYTTLLHATTHAEARLSNPFQPLLLTIVAGAVMTTVTTSGVSIPYRRDLTKVTGKIKRLGKSNIIFLSIVAACCLYAGLSLYRNNFVVNGEFFRSKTRSDAATEVWDANGDQVIATQDGVVKVQTMPTVAQDKVTAVVTNAPLVTQEIRYHMPEAGEVFLAWGINGWNVVAEKMRPAGTVVKDAVMHTPMALEGDTFVTKVQIPSGTTVDYGFLIIKTRSGTAIKVWEANGDQDYHTIATKDGVTEVQTGLTLAQVQTPGNVPGTILPLVIGLSLALGISITLIRRRDSVAFYLRTLLHRRRLIYLRDLLRELVARDMKLRYKRSVLGIAWSLLNPLAQLLIFTFLFRRVLPLNIPNYPLFVFSGVLAWSWFQSSLFLATGAITDNRELIRRPGFPAAILPVVTVTSNLVHFLLALPILLLFVLIGGLHLTSTSLMLPLVIVLQFLLTLSLAYLVATFHVTFRDTQHLLGVMLLLLFYLTPVFYDAGAVPAPYQPFYRLNPMLHLINAYRAILIRGELPDMLSLLGLCLLTAALLWLGYTIFMRASYRFVEEL